MLSFDQVIKYFSEKGAHLEISSDQLMSQFIHTDVFIFDWDGVFNNGVKMGDSGSSFAEPDSMATNLMRLSYFLKNGKMPLMGVITGASNEGSKFLAQRENFDFIIRGFHNKSMAIHHLNNEFRVDPDKTLFMWDDLIDYPISKWAKTGIQVKRDVHPLFNAFSIKQGCTSYITANDGDQYAIRELSEVYMAAMGNAEETFLVRGAHAEQYAVYLKAKGAIKTKEIKK